MKIKTPDFLPPDRVEIDMAIEEKKKKMKEINKLKKEEEKLYEKLMSYVRFLTKKQQQEFCETLSLYIDTQIELEKFCSQ